MFHGFHVLRTCIEELEVSHQHSSVYPTEVKKTNEETFQDSQQA